MKRILLAAALSAAVMLGYGHHVYAASIDAIAIDDDAGTKGGNAGWGTGEGDTGKEAGRMAMQNCKKAGGEDCKVVLTYGKCGAYASSKKYFGTGTGASEGEATKAAIEACGRDSCKLVVADCVGK